MFTQGHFKNIGRVNYLGQPMLQRICYCQATPQVKVYSSKPRSR